MLSRRWRLLLLGIAVVLAIAYSVASWSIMDQALVAKVTPLKYTPELLGLAYQDISFHPRGGETLTLRGWWLPANGTPEGTVIWVHGLDSNRAAELPFLRDLVDNRFNVLSFDLRGEGLSDYALMGAGLAEQRDVRGAIDYALEDEGAQPGKLFLVGVSFGAAIVLLVGPTEPAVAGVYADSSFAALGDMIAGEVARRTPLPLWAAKVLEPGLILAARVFRGININTVEPVKVVARYSYPIGIAHCYTDQRIPYRDAILLYQHAPAGSWFEAYPCEHAKAYDSFPQQYTSTVLGYLHARLSAEAPIATHS